MGIQSVRFSDAAALFGAHAGCLGDGAPLGGHGAGEVCAVGRGSLDDPERVGVDAGSAGDPCGGAADSGCGGRADAIPVNGRVLETSPDVQEEPTTKLKVSIVHSLKVSHPLPRAATVISLNDSARMKHA